MRVFITGGSGMIGLRLAQDLLDAGHGPVILSRKADQVRRKPEMWPYEVVQGDPTKEGRWQEALDGCDAVVNLAGHNIFADRWNPQIKRTIRDSRVQSAEQVVAAIQRARMRPKVLIQGSAVGFYGPQGNRELDETSPSGSDFLAVVCRECEEVSARIEAAGVRRAIVRTGIVLARGAGALKLMTPIFKVGPGLPIGSGGKLVAQGNQWMSWIHIDDIVGIFRLALENANASGPLNGTAPEPVSNADFAKTFSSVLRTRATPWRVFVPFGPPDAMLRLALGEVASVITTGQRVLPTKALALGYHFKYPHLAGALCALNARTVAPAAQAAPAHAAGTHAHH